MQSRKLTPEEGAICYSKRHSKSPPRALLPLLLSQTQWKRKTDQKLGKVAGEWLQRLGFPWQRKGGDDDRCHWTTDTPIMCSNLKGEKSPEIPSLLVSTRSWQISSSPWGRRKEKVQKASVCIYELFVIQAVVSREEWNPSLRTCTRNSHRGMESMIITSGDRFRQDFASALRLLKEYHSGISM